MISYFEIMLMLLYALVLTLIILKVGRRVDAYITKKTNWEYGTQQLVVALILIATIVVPAMVSFVITLIVRWNSML